APPLAAAIRASVAHARGNSEPARREWERAAAGFDSAGMALHAQASRARLGDLVGGATGRGLRDTAEAWIGDQGVVRPAQMLQMVVP
ncbi:MAG TPA: hypothetical protein VHZ95_04015, partial [Polyangiales bacterium]|nr:hypothetical protein [Polyangiales bacterium]